MEEDEPPKTWQGALKRLRVSKTDTTRRLSRWIYDLYKEQGPGTPFTLMDMMEGCGMDCKLRKDYSSAMGFLVEQRKHFETVIDIFFRSERFQQLKASGVPDQDMFLSLVDNALEYGIYPVWADPADCHKYKLFDLTSYLFLVHKRAKSTVKEIERRSVTMGTLKQNLPEVAGTYERVQLAADGYLIELPSAIECEICGAHFDSQAEFAEHYVDKHCSEKDDLK